MGKLLPICVISFLLLTPVSSQTDKKDEALIKRQRAEIFLYQLTDQIKAIDELEVRVFLRFRIATYLWDKQIRGESDLAEKLATDGLDDIDLHKNEMKPRDIAYYRGNLIGLLRVNCPESAKTLSNKYEADTTRQDSYGTAKAMLVNKEGTSKALEAVTANLNNGLDGGMGLVGFLWQLKKVNIDNYLQVLRQILAIESARPLTFSLQTISMLQNTFLESGVPADVQAGFLNLVVSRAEMTSSDNSRPEDIRLAYMLVNASYNKVVSINPAISDRTRNILALLGQRIPPSIADGITSQLRIDNSSDKLTQIREEITATPYESSKDTLRAQGARVALERGELREATAFAEKISLTNESSAKVRDLVLKEIVDSALKKRDDEIARSALKSMKGHLNRSAVMQKMSLYYFESKDISRSRELLGDAVKETDSVDNAYDKSLGFLQLVPVFQKIDEVKTFDILKLAIDASNKIKRPSSSYKLESDEWMLYGNSIVAVAWHTIPAFREESQRDENACSILMNQILSPEIKAAALWGITTQLFESSKPTEQPDAN